jgi:hypothetical protein
VLFHSGLRAWGFERVRSRATVGDWFARVDADEFYHVCPREFIEERLGRTDGRLCAQLYDFVLTTRDVRAWEAGEEGIADRGRPIEDRRRVWRINEWPELRLFRYRRGRGSPSGIINAATRCSCSADVPCGQGRSRPGGPWARIGESMIGGRWWWMRMRRTCGHGGRVKRSLGLS